MTNRNTHEIYLHRLTSKLMPLVQKRAKGLGLSTKEYLIDHLRDNELEYYKDNASDAVDSLIDIYTSGTKIIPWNTMKNKELLSEIIEGIESILTIDNWAENLKELEEEEFCEEGGGGGFF